MSTNVFDQFGRSGAKDHLIRRNATMVGIGVDIVKDVSRLADLLSLAWGGVLGKEFEAKLKKRKENNKKVQRFGSRDSFVRKAGLFKQFQKKSPAHDCV